MAPTARRPTGRRSPGVCRAWGGVVPGVRWAISVIDGWLGWRLTSRWVLGGGFDGAGPLLGALYILQFIYMRGYGDRGYLLMDAAGPIYADSRISLWGSVYVGDGGCG